MYHPKALGIERNQQKNIDGYMDRKTPKDEELIEQPSKKKMLLFAGSSNPELAEKVAGELRNLLSLS